MRTVRVNKENVKDFIAYCTEFAPEHDESYIPQEDFLPRSDEPAFLILDGNGKPAGAVSLMLHPEYIAIKKGRFRIFHSTETTAKNYGALLDSVLPLANGVESVYCFVHEQRTTVRKIWEELGFRISRYSFLFERKLDEFELPSFPHGYTLINFEAGKDEAVWCDVVNTAFARMEGHRPLYPSKISEWKKEKGYIEGGLKILWDNDKPVGTVQMEKDVDDGQEILFIGALSVLPEFQHKGLGRNMLRASFEFGKDHGFSKAMLTVNAENEKAVELYYNEGFKKKEVVVCYSFTA